MAFAVMFGVFHADEALFRAGWFVESLATWTLIIFVVRTRRSRVAEPSELGGRARMASPAAGALPPLTPLGRWLVRRRSHSACRPIAAGASITV